MGGIQGKLPQVHTRKCRGYVPKNIDMKWLRILELVRKDRVALFVQGAR
jgi:hypothetical protein